MHGDFHHHNILALGARLRRDRPAAVARRAGVRRPVRSSGTRSPTGFGVELLERRLAAFVAAGLDEERMRIWTVIRGAYLQPEEAEALRALV